MTGWIRHAPKARGLFALLLLCVLAVRVAIPTGFMPTRGSHGIVVSFCTGEGAVRMILPVERHGDDAPAHQDKDGPCVFAAGLGNGLIPPVLPALALVAVIWPPLPISTAIADLTVHRLAAPPPPSQAPPAQA